MTFEKKLRALRRRDNLTQIALANAVGVTRQSVYLWEKGESYPEAEQLLALRRLFGVSIDTLLDDSLPLPEGRETVAPPAPKKRVEAAQNGHVATEKAKTPGKKVEPPVPEQHEEPEYAPEPRAVEARAEAGKEGAPLRAKVEPNRVKTGNIIDLFGAFFRKKK